MTGQLIPRSEGVWLVRVYLGSELDTGSPGLSGLPCPFPLNRGFRLRPQFRFKDAPQYRPVVLVEPAKCFVLCGERVRNRTFNLLIKSRAKRIADGYPLMPRIA
jgi:hypothetical protein